MTIKKIERNSESAIQRLIRGKSIFESFYSLEDWYAETDETIANKELEYFTFIKKYFLLEFKKRDIYISSYGLDDIIFNCIKNSNPNEFKIDVLKLIELNNLDAKSIVIFPIHNFGFQFLGLKNAFNGSFTSLEIDNFQICTQSNSLEKTQQLIINYAKKVFGKKIDISLLQHFYKSRSLKWLTKNPLLLFEFNFTQITPFDNLSIILEKLSHITNKLYFISVLRSEESDLGKLFSTKNSNNWETLDLEHFLTINGNDTNNFFCLPIHYNYNLLFDEMHLNIDLLVKKKSIYKWEKESLYSIDKISEGNKNFLITKEKKYLPYHKVSNSLKYFRRSVKSVNDEDKILNFNIALESLLLDNEGKKVVKILERISKSLKYSRNKKKLLENIENIIDQRNSIVHNATMIDKNFNMLLAYRMYCKIVCFISNNIESIDFNEPNKMAKFFDHK